MPIINIVQMALDIGRIINIDEVNNQTTSQVYVHKSPGFNVPGTKVVKMALNFGI